MKKKQNTKTSRDRLQSEAITLYAAGLSVREIARQLNTSPATISRILSPLRTSNDASTNSSAVSPRRDAALTSPNSSSAAKQIGEESPRDGWVNTLAPTTEKIKDKINTAVADIIKQIQQCTFGETDIAKLATAADKLSTIAERIANIERLSQADNTQQGAFTADFTSRHRQQQHKNN